MDNCFAIIIDNVSDGMYYPWLELSLLIMCNFLLSRYIQQILYVHIWGSWDITPRSVSVKLSGESTMYFLVLKF